MGEEKSEAVERETRERWLRADFEGATRLLIEGYGPQVLGFLVHTMRNEDDASEVFSRFCEHLWRGIAKFEGRSSFKTWVYRLATHARTRFWEDPYRHRGVRLSTDAMLQIEEDVRSRTIRYLRSEVKSRFARIRERLSADEQTLLTLRVDKGLSWSELAEVLSDPEEPCSEKDLGLKATALRQRFQRLKDKIRRIAQKEGLMEVAE